MQDYRSWRPVHQAMCPAPGPRDLFLVILINGRRVAIEHASDHAKWKHAAERLAHEHECHVKVLPMEGGEMMNFLGIKPAPPQSIENLDPAFRKRAIETCFELLRESAEPREREEALALLGHLGMLAS